MNTLVIVATLLSCSLAAPSGLLHGLHGLPLAHHGLPLAHHGLPLAHHGLPLAHAVEVKAVEGEEVKALPLIHAAPHHYAPHAYAAEVRTFTLDHEPVVIPHVEPKVIEVEGHPSVYHTSYHAETERVEHPVVIPHHSVEHVQPTIAVHHAPVAVHHAPVAYHHAEPVVHHAPAAYHHAPAVYHHAAPLAVHHAAPFVHGYAVKAEEAEE